MRSRPTCFAAASNRIAKDRAIRDKHEQRLLADIDKLSRRIANKKPEKTRASRRPPANISRIRTGPAGYSPEHGLPPFDVCAREHIKFDGPQRSALPELIHRATCEFSRGSKCEKKMDSRSGTTPLERR